MLVDIKMFVATKIKEYRKMRHLTQRELGEKVGVKHNTISSYEGFFMPFYFPIFIKMC